MDGRAEGARYHGALDLRGRRRRADADRVHRNPSKARDVALSYAAAIAVRAGIIETTSRKRPRPTFFGEQTVLCGGCAELVKAGFDTLVDAGYAPEMLYWSAFTN